MIILTIRTDKPEAEVGLYQDEKQLGYETWQAHRQLAETIHIKIRDLLRSQSRDWQSIEGLVAFKGPGSFTGLRIGITVANAIAYAQNIPIVATMGDGWIAEGVKNLLSGENDTIAMPEYGAEANTTKPRR